MTMGERRAARRRAWRFGRVAEGLCVGLLLAKGYRVVARDLRTPAGEIDIVAHRGGVLAFVEVKARAHHGEPALGPRQRRRIERAAAAFLSMRPRFAGLAMRFDLMEVAPWRLPRHRKGAWRPDD